MSKKGQALIEAIAGLGLSVLFLTSCLKLLSIAVTDFKKEARQRESEICNLSGSPKCASQAGFVLVTMLMHLSVLVFSFYVLIGLFLTEEFRWKISNWCFEAGLAKISERVAAPKTDLATIQKEINQTAPQIIRFKTFLEGPVRRDNADTGHSESYFTLTWVSHSQLTQKFFKLGDFTNQLKCGARKVCHDEKCVYSIIADKS